MKDARKAEDRRPKTEGGFCLQSTAYRLQPYSFILHPSSFILFCVVALPIAGACVGRVAAPALARMNYIVKVAEHVWNEEQNGPGEEEDIFVTAFRATGMPAAQIYAQADEIRGRFARGAMWFGLWCGLVAGAHIAASFARRRRSEYEPDPMECFACGRCFLACPIERKRVRRLGEGLAEQD
jgi:ferredoxin